MQSNTTVACDLRTEHNLCQNKLKDIMQNSQKQDQSTADDKNWVTFSEYASSTSIHGVQYIGENGRSLLERIFWSIVITISVCLCVHMISNTWNKWNDTPVVINFDNKESPIWSIPFPAITICPETKVKSEIFNFTDAILKILDYGKIAPNLNDIPENLLSSDESVYLTALFQVCLPNFLPMSKFNSTKVDLPVILKKMAPKWKEIVVDCEWNENVPCEENSVVPTVTENGICFTYNGFHHNQLYRKEFENITEVAYDWTYKLSHWNIEDGYKNGITKDIFPKRALKAGAKSGLSLYLASKIKDLDYLCSGTMQGFKILLHVPDEAAQSSKKFIRVPLNEDVIVTIKPKLIKTSEVLRDYEPENRNCFFSNERPLRFFNTYNQHNCRLECLSNKTLETCQCVPFYMPRSNDTKICGISDFSCFKNVERNLIRDEVNQELINLKSQQCNCLPSCTSLAYNIEVSQADFDVSKVFAFQKSETLKYKFSRLTIFFKENQFLPLQRSELFGLTDFLANCGGLLGLFMGVSALSFIEILYFLTIRLASNLNLRRRSLVINQDS